MRFRVAPFDGLLDHYDSLVGAVGYESRCLYVAGNLNSSKSHLFSYGANAGASVRENEMRAERMAGMEVAPIGTIDEFRARVGSLAASVRNSHNVAIDISSFDRRRLAILLESFAVEYGQRPGATLDILYTPAEFSPPSPQLAGRSLEAGPIGDRFQGHLRRTSLPLAAVFGLGYEPQRAIGGFELLEPSRAFAFWPESGDGRFEDSLLAANRLLLSIFATNDVLRYPVLDPSDIYYRLESLVSGLAPEHRVVLVPMGPKIFAACCIVLGLGDGVERPAVWRIGLSGPSLAADARPRGEIVGLRLIFN